MPDYNFQPAPGGAAILAAGTATANVALAVPASNYEVLVINDSAVIAYVSLGASNTATATTAGVPVRQDLPYVGSIGANTYIAAITQSGTCALQVFTGKRRVHY